MKKRVYKYLRERGKPEPPLPLWQQLLWLIAIVGFCGIVFYRLTYGV